MSTDTNVVDWTTSDPNVNMYGCRPCPKCKSVYRYAHKEGGKHVICCDDCGYREAVAKEIS